MWDFLKLVWPLLLMALNTVLATAATIHAVLNKRDSRAVIAWVGLVWLAPLWGSLLYFGFGINRIQRKGASLRLKDAWTRSPIPTLTAADTNHVQPFSAAHLNLVGQAELVRRLTGHPLLPGNSVEPLVNGDQAYPAMLRAIDQAERSVTLLSYIFDSDRTGNQFLDALVRAKERGVAVRVLVDDVGLQYGRSNIVRKLQRQGLEVASFLPTRVRRLFKFANLRNHRKILVVDGRVGFTGGTNIRDAHCLALNPEYPVQCLHFRLEGPVVAQLQETFAVDWAFAHEESLGGELWFPAIDRVGQVWARGVAHGPDEDFEKMTHTILGAITAARETLCVVTPYFLPHASLIDALNVAAMRGVKVSILVPEQNNIFVAQWASTALFWQLLEKGCRIFLTPPPFDHTKLLVVDSQWSLIGSANWDPRSLRLNFEFDVECYDAALASTLSALIDEKQARAREITLAEVESRPLPIRLRDGLARLLSPYL